MSGTMNEMARAIATANPAMLAERLRELGACESGIATVEATDSAEEAWASACISHLWWVLSRLDHPALPELRGRFALRAQRAAAWALAAAVAHGADRSLLVHAEALASAPAGHTATATAIDAARDAADAAHADAAAWAWAWTAVASHATDAAHAAHAATYAAGTAHAAECAAGAAASASFAGDAAAAAAAAAINANPNTVYTANVTAIAATYAHAAVTAERHAQRADIEELVPLASVLALLNARGPG